MSAAVAASEMGEATLLSIADRSRLWRCLICGSDRFLKLRRLDCKHYEGTNGCVHVIFPSTSMPLIQGQSVLHLPAQATINGRALQCNCCRPRLAFATADDGRLGHCAKE